MMRFFLLPALMIVAPGITTPVWADGFGINATRLIYPEKAASISVAVRNTQSSTPYLVQAAVSGTQDTRTPAPFTVTPPLFRLEPQSINQLRIARNLASLPTDRESIFYLHATAIPASATSTASQNEGGIQGSTRFGVGNIIKLFYRPADLKGSSADAQRGLRFARVQGGLMVTNPSPYFVNLASLKANGVKLALDTPTALMLAPRGSNTWPLKTPLAAHTGVEWQTINDTGGTDAFSTSVP